MDDDLTLISPSSGSIQETGRPTLRWQAYPGATAYKVSLSHLSEAEQEYDVGHIALPLQTISEHEDKRKPQCTRDTEVSPSRDLQPGWYHWSVTALDANGQVLAYSDCGHTPYDIHWSFGIAGDEALVDWLWASYDYSDQSRLSIYNETTKELTLNLVGHGEVVVTPTTRPGIDNRDIEISPGTYAYTAAISGLPPVSGSIVVGQKGPQVLTFYVSSSASSPPTVATSDEGSITTSSAQLNGDLSTLGTASIVAVSFVWGTSSGSCPNETTIQSMTSTGTFHFDLSSLSPGATYYYRAKAVGHGGAVYGVEKSFTTVESSSGVPAWRWVLIGLAAAGGVCGVACLISKRVVRQ
jgi:hypothetical protein